MTGEHVLIGVVILLNILIFAGMFYSQELEKSK